MLVDPCWSVVVLLFRYISNFCCCCCCCCCCCFFLARDYRRMIFSESSPVYMAGHKLSTLNNLARFLILDNSFSSMIKYTIPWKFMTNELQNSIIFLNFHCLKSVQIRSSFWSVFFYNRTEYGDLRSKSQYSVRIQENTDQKILLIWTLFTQCSKRN